MQFCTVCGRPKAKGSSSCSGCGNPFVTAEPFSPYEPEPRWKAESARAAAPRARSSPSRRLKRASIGAAGGLALAIAVVGVTLWPHNDQPAGRVTGVQAGTPSPGSAGSAPAGAVSPVADTPPSSPASPSGSVAMAAAAAADSDSATVLSFLDSYFSAINGHDYQSYLALLTPDQQQEITQADFDSGYQGTADSAETLTGVSDDADGDVAAAVTFSSHQDPDSADNEESCTDWRITLFLEPDGSSYLIDQPPQGYHAASQPCS